MDVLPSILGELLFPTVSDADGRMKTSQYGLCKIEAALIDAGFSRDDVAIVDPRKIEVAIGPRTRAVGIGVLDPPGSQLWNNAPKSSARAHGGQDKATILHVMGHDEVTQQGERAEEEVWV
jgi:hypothetical protein